MLLLLHFQALLPACEQFWQCSVHFSCHCIHPKMFSDNLQELLLQGHLVASGKGKSAPCHWTLVHCGSFAFWCSCCGDSSDPGYQPCALFWNVSSVVAEGAAGCVRQLCTTASRKGLYRAHWTSRGEGITGISWFLVQVPRKHRTLCGAAVPVDQLDTAHLMLESPQAQYHLGRPASLI